MKLNLYDIFESIDAFKKIAKERSEKDAYIEDSNHIINKLAYSKWMFDLCSTYNNGKLVDLSPENMQKKFDTDKELQKSFFNILFNFIKKKFEGRFGFSDFNCTSRSSMDFRVIYLKFEDSEKEEQTFVISLYEITKPEDTMDFTIRQIKENHEEYAISQSLRFKWEENSFIQLLIFTGIIFNIIYNPASRFDIFCKFISEITNMDYFTGIDKQPIINFSKTAKYSIIQEFILSFFIKEHALYDKLKSSTSGITNILIVRITDYTSVPFRTDIVGYEQILVKMIINAFKRCKNNKILLDPTHIAHMMKKIMEKTLKIDTIDAVCELPMS